MSNRELVYEDLLGRGKREVTARAWRSYIVRFEGCCGVKDSYGRGDVIKFMAVLRQNGMNQNSINTVIRSVKLLCEIQRWGDGFPRLAMPKVRRSDIKRPRLSVKEVGYIIGKAKKVCSEREVAFLALSTVYGLRRVELGSLELYDGVVKIDTCKGGEVAVQLVPDEVKEFIKGYYGSNDDKYMTRVFWNVISKVGLSLDAGHGWHSIRRVLASELLECDVSAVNVLRFMRWSDASIIREIGMLGIYSECKQDKVDRSIFKVHPFLRYW